MIEYNIRTNRLFGSSPNFRDGILDRSYFFTILYNKLLAVKRQFIQHPYGMEDVMKNSNFERNVEAIIGIAKALDTKIILTTFAHNRPDVENRKNNWGYSHPEKVAAFGISQHNDILRKLAEKHELPIAGVAVLTGEVNVFTDFVHMTNDGKQKMADIVYPYVERAILSKSGSVTAQKVQIFPGQTVAAQKK